MELWLEEHQRQGDAVECAAVLETLSGPHRLWYRVPAEHESEITSRADPFVIGTLFAAMHSGGSLHVHGEVGAGLVGNLRRFQEAWLAWRPELYRPVDIIADREPIGWYQPPARRLVAFSGGLDSCFSVFRARAWCPSEDLVGVMVHGFDVPLDNVEGFARAAVSARGVLGSVGASLVTMTTNFRDLPGHWHDTHGVAVAASLHVLAGRARGGIFASTHPFDRLQMPWGSCIVTDPLLSSDQFPVVSDGGPNARKDKAAIVSEWPEAMANLRVCWRSPDVDRNCGRCSKCIFTGLCFAVEGVPVPTSVPLPALEQAIAVLATVPLAAFEWRSFPDLLDRARERGLEAPWVKALAELVATGHPDVDGMPVPGR